jgi:hypothetical protein
MKNPGCAGGAPVRGGHNITPKAYHHNDQMSIAHEKANPAIGSQRISWACDPVPTLINDRRQRWRAARSASLSEPVNQAEKYRHAQKNQRSNRCAL